MKEDNERGWVASEPGIGKHFRFRVQTKPGTDGVKSMQTADGGQTHEPANEKSRTPQGHARRSRKVPQAPRRVDG
jgi:hypothetical protein